MIPAIAAGASVLASTIGGTVGAANAAKGGREAKGAAQSYGREASAIARQYDAYRAARPEARMQALSQQMAAFDPVRQKLLQMYGPKYAFDMEAMTRNPITPELAAAGMGRPRGNQGATFAQTPEQQNASATYADPAPPAFGNWKTQQHGAAVGASPFGTGADNPAMARQRGR